VLVSALETAVRLIAAWLKLGLSLEERYHAAVSLEDWQNWHVICTDNLCIDQDAKLFDFIRQLDQFSDDVFN
jgi:hypothetical protein